jgi:hypothetical protein
VLTPFNHARSCLMSTAKIFQPETLCHEPRGGLPNSPSE